MKCKTTVEFQNEVLKNMTFTPYKDTNFILYKNHEKPELGYFIKYSREGYYDFGIGDYTIPHNFTLSFEHSEELMRFGTVYSGETKFRIEDEPVSSFTPSSFFVVERHLKGNQVWEKGQHFHGAEITIYKKYLEEVINPAFPDTINFQSFLSNYTYHHLPLDIAKIIEVLRSLGEKHTLTPLYLESKLLECLAIIHQELSASPENVFTNQLDYGHIEIGKSRKISLTASDVNAIQRAHDILSEDPCNPPTIKALSKEVFLNEQKLKAGFKARYHMSISQYTTSLKIAMAETLLSTTELSVEEIAKALGYSHSGNFVKMFKKAHGKTPLAFRRRT